MKLRLYLILFVSNLVAAHHIIDHHKCKAPSRCQSVNECTELFQQVLGWLTKHRKSFSEARNIVKLQHPSCKRGWGVCCPYGSFFERQIEEMRMETTTTSKFVETTPKIIQMTTKVIQTTTKAIETTPKIPETTPSAMKVSPDSLESKYHAYQVLKKHPNFRLLTGPHCGFGFFHRIAHGENAEPGELPWIVMLRYLEKRKPVFRCGGSLISSRYVLTAAHCIIDNRIKDFKLTSVWLGETSLVNTLDCMDTADGNRICADLPQEIMIDEAIPHPDFSYKHFLRGFPNDIGIVRLAKEAEFSTFVKPICLAGLANLGVQRFMNTNFKSLTVAGWGMVNMKADPLSSELQVANVTIVEREKCHELHKRKPHKCQLCAGGTTGNACLGDSGGPLIAEADKNSKLCPLVVGVTSVGLVHCGYEVPTVFTDVTCYLPWILDNIKK